jgi:hypothetical protein
MKEAVWSSRTLINLYRAFRSAGRISYLTWFAFISRAFFPKLPAHDLGNDIGIICFSTFIRTWSEVFHEPEFSIVQGNYGTSGYVALSVSSRYSMMALRYLHQVSARDPLVFYSNGLSLLESLYLASVKWIILFGETFQFTESLRTLPRSRHLERDSDLGTLWTLGGM